MIAKREQPGDPMPEWLDLKALTGYACVSERTLREWIHRPRTPCRPCEWERNFWSDEPRLINGWKITC